MAQDIPLETWQSHFSYQKVNHLAKGDDKIFAASENGFFYYDLQDESINIISKVDGLSDVNISSLYYAEDHSSLVIGYSSGAVDIVVDGIIHTINDLKETDLIEDKGVRDIAFWDGNVYLATSLGIIVVSLDKIEITENYRSIGTNGNDLSVYELYISNDSLYAITSQGIQVGALKENLLDFNNWFYYKETGNAKYAHLGMKDQEIYAIKKDTILVRLQNHSWLDAGITFGEAIIDVQESQGLFFAQQQRILTFDGEQLSEVYTAEGDITLKTFLLDDIIWLGSQSNGLVNSQSNEKFYPNGPASDQIDNMKVIDGNTYAFYFPDPEEYDGSSLETEFSSFQSRTWGQQSLEGFPNVSDVASWNNQLYFSSIGYGLYNSSGKNILDYTNDQLSDSKGNLGLLITSISASEKLIASSFNNENPIFFLDSNEGIHTLSEGQVGTDLPKTASCLNDLIFINISEVAGGGFITYDLDNGNRKYFGIDDGLPGSSVRNIELDFDENAWISTNNGIVTYPDAAFIMEFGEPVVPAYENNFLFENEPVNYVKADGGNRIWISTESGLWVFSEDFSSIDHYFTPENSPLPSNHIKQMEYNPHNGEMFILTNKGLVSFRSSSSVGESNLKMVDIYPNPVRPGYSGLVGISGLIKDTKVKITNVHGKLIRELDTNGGTTSWDLLDYNDHRVPSGIYIIFSAIRDGSDKFVGKIAVIN